VTTEKQITILVDAIADIYFALSDLHPSAEFVKLANELEIGSWAEEPPELENDD